MQLDSDIVIVGGGLNGPSLALALAQAGLSVTLLDARAAGSRAEAGFDGRAYALSIASVRLLQAIGVWPELAAKAQPMQEIITRDARPGTGQKGPGLIFDHGEIEEGPMGHMVEDRHLYAAFLAAMAQQNGLRLISGARALGQEVGGAGVRLDYETDAGSQAQVLARLVIGCDGRGSGVAKGAGIRRQGWDYGQTALVAALGHERDHQGRAYQIFNPEGPFAILPLAGGHRSSIVWSLPRAEAEAIAALDDAGFMAALALRLGDFLGDLRLEGGRFSYPLALSLAERFAAPRLALVGDAAHGVHPIAGQGLNLGLKDAAALAEVLVAARRRGEDIGALDVLQRYESWRRFDATSLALGMDGVNRVFSNDNPILRGLRDLGMGLVGRAPALRRAFIRQAAGIAPGWSGEVPKLMRGERL